MKGQFLIQVSEKTIACVDNLILKQGLERFAANNQRSYCVLGTGRTPAQLMDTELENQIAGSATISDFSFWYDQNPFRLTHSIVYNFAVPPEGLEFSEVGIGSLGLPLLSRALIQDANGNETIIKVNPDESLRIVHSITYTPIMDDLVTVANINGSNHRITVRAADVGDQLRWRSVAGAVKLEYAEFFEEFELTSPTGRGDRSGTSVEDLVLLPVRVVDSKLQYRASILGSQNRPAIISGLYFRTGGDLVSDAGMAGLSGAYQVKFNPPIPVIDDRDFIFTFELELL